MKRRWVLPLFALMLTLSSANAQSPKDDEAAIRSAITAQVGAWNKADIDGFMTPYENSDETTFIGTNLRKGYKPIRQRYMDAYPSSTEMGRLSFSDLEVKLIPNSCGPADVALVTGRYHLVLASSAEKSGIFSLVWHKGPKGWKIILDHTS